MSSCIMRKCNAIDSLGRTTKRYMDFLGEHIPQTANDIILFHPMEPDEPWEETPKVY